MRAISELLELPFQVCLYHLHSERLSSFICFPLCLLKTFNIVWNYKALTLIGHCFQVILRAWKICLSTKTFRAVQRLLRAICCWTACLAHIRCYVSSKRFCVLLERTGRCYNWWTAERHCRCQHRGVRPPTETRRRLSICQIFVV